MCGEGNSFLSPAGASLKPRSLSTHDALNESLRQVKWTLRICAKMRDNDDAPLLDLHRNSTPDTANVQHGPNTGSVRIAESERESESQFGFTQSAF